MSETSHLSWDQTSIDLPNVIGSEGERAIDITKLRSQTGAIALDEGYRNTGACQSSITYINGEKGVLRYRGIPIEQVATQSTFIETAWLLIFGDLPTQTQLDTFKGLIAEQTKVNEKLLELPAALAAGQGDAGTHPMAMFSAMIQAAGGYQPAMLAMEGDDWFTPAAAALLAQGPVLAAAIHRAKRGEPATPGDPKRGYCENLLHMMFDGTDKAHAVDESAAHAVNMILMLHADHEQNCSTSTVRMVASSQANLFASCAAGVSALWGPLHGGANIAVLKQLNEIHDSGVSVKDYLENLKKTKERLFGFGHAVYKNFDPRAKLLKNAADRLLGKHPGDDPLLDIARQLEETALKDDYFVQRKLYPNVDFYSGVIMQAMGISTRMFTVMFAVGRMAGWIAHFKEVRDGPGRIYRPRQVYVGPRQRDYVPVESRVG